MWRRRAISLLRTGRRFMSDGVEGSEATVNYSEKTRIVYTGERGINQVTLLGRVGVDAVQRGSTANPVSVFSLATSKTLQKPDGEYQQITDWHRIVVFRPGLRDKVAETVKQGDKVYVSGAIKYSQYQPDESRDMVKVANIVADDVMIVQKSPNNSHG